MFTMTITSVKMKSAVQECPLLHDTGCDVASVLLMIWETSVVA